MKISSKVVKQWQRESQVKRVSNNKEEKLESATIFGVKKSIVGDFEDWKSPPGGGPGGTRLLCKRHSVDGLGVEG